MFGPEIRAKVRNAYVYEKLPINEAARRAGINHQTARRWKKNADDTGDSWDRARNASRIAGGGLGDLTYKVVEDFIILFESTIDGLKKHDKVDPIETAEAIARLSDSYVKVIKAAGGSDRKLSELAVAMKVIKMLSDYIREHHPKQVEIFLTILEPFGQVLSTELK